MKKHLIIFLILLLLEILIAKYEFHSIIRGFVGDILVIPLLFSFGKIFTSFSSEKILLGVLLFAMILEFLQLLSISENLGIKSEVLKTIIGSVFDPLDILSLFYWGLT